MAKSESQESKPVGRYRVKQGVHSQEGKTYGKGMEEGDIVESSKNLAEWDPIKFEDLDARTAQAQQEEGKAEGKGKQGSSSPTSGKSSTSTK